ncbi:amidase [Marinobacter sp. 2_MG-2023]|uniref:amidase n=1 Tax=Marinobacter sp. 2_MG-2023 TaxID=3062679 RepID=UPI0026E12D9A|nr:amidase [Marinobacter sp. 2_MG-2023]MDO6440956.1 amidase [Marinobacter sp. 2_MG-2023]
MSASDSPKIANAFTDDALGTDDGTALAERIRSRDVSVTEVTQAAIQRLRKVEPLIHSIVAERYEQVLGAAAKLDKGNSLTEAPFFSGVPTFIKDNTNVAGMATRMGSDAVPAGHPLKKTSPFAQQMLAQGFLCLGKSTMPEFGFNASTEYAHGEPSRNPWNLAYSAGASSGGSAALVASGAIPIAHANDGGGSTRIPAACCGLVGLKPTCGRVVDNDAAKSLPINILSDSVVTRSVRDTANFIYQAERYFRNTKLPHVGKVDGATEKRLRIGLVIDSINGHKTDGMTRKTVEATARRLEAQGHHIEPVRVPANSTFPEDFALYWAMLAFGIQLHGRKLTHPGFDKRRVDALTQGLDRMFRKNFWRMPAILWRLRRARFDYAKAMAGFDAVLTPVLGHTTPRLGHLSPNVPFDTLFDRLTRYANFTPLANVTGAPAISLPAARSPENLPVSVQIMGRHGEDRTLLEIAFGLEADHPWPLICEKR